MTVDEIRAQIARYPGPEVGYITVPSPALLQSRVTRNRRTWGATFSIQDYGDSIAATYRAARAYLNALAPDLPASHRLRSTNTSDKSSDLPPGVSIGPRYDRRRDITYMVVQVLWHDGKQSRNKVFYIGRVDVVDPADYAPVIEIAIAFRHAYERARKAGTVFDPLPWKYWRYQLPEVVRERLSPPRETESSRRAVSL